MTWRGSWGTECNDVTWQKFKFSSWLCRWSALYFPVLYFLTHLSCSRSSSAVNFVYVVEFISKLCCLNGLNDQETGYIKHVKDDGKKKQNILFPVGKLLCVLFNDKCVFGLKVIQPVITCQYFLHTWPISLESQESSVVFSNKYFCLVKSFCTWMQSRLVN